MIFATVGTQEPFERMVSALDLWAERNESIQVLAQIGKGRPPRRIAWVESMPAAEFRRAIAQAELIVAHAGMGTLLHALQLGKRIVVMPRRAALGEHRSDHQQATAERFCKQRGIMVVHEAEELARVLDNMHGVIPAQPIRREASPELLRTLCDFIATARPRS